jgi:endonuclease III
MEAELEKVTGGVKIPGWSEGHVHHVFARKLQRVVSLLSRLPGVGEKTAQRYVLFL